MRLSGSLAVLALVSFFFMPLILAQKESRLLPPSGWGAFNPGLPGLALLYEARPFAFKPPLGFLPSLRVHAADLAIKHRDVRVGTKEKTYAVVGKNAFAGN